MKIKKGTKIDTVEGYYEVTGYNGSIVYLTEYKYDDAGELVSVDADVRMTITEIANHIHSMDGLNHRVIWEEYMIDQEGAAR